MLRATVDGAVWIGHVRREDTPDALKLPTAMVLARRGRRRCPAHRSIDAVAVVDHRRGARSATRAAAGVGYLHFDFHNGAMSTAQCERLRAAYCASATRGPSAC